MCFIVNNFSARRIALSSRLSPSDWAHLRIIVKKAGTIWLRIKTEIDWDELETALRNINSKELFVSLKTEVKYESETGDHIKRLATLCKQVIVTTLRLSEGRCGTVIISTNKILMGYVDLQSGDDVTRLHHLVSQYQSWQVGWLYLTELGSDDWALLAQLLLQTLTLFEFCKIVCCCCRCVATDYSTELISSLSDHFVC